MKRCCFSSVGHKSFGGVSQGRQTATEVLGPLGCRSAGDRCRDSRQAPQRCPKGPGAFELMLSLPETLPDSGAGRHRLVSPSHPRPASERCPVQAASAGQESGERHRQAGESWAGAVDRPCAGWSRNFLPSLPFQSSGFSWETPDLPAAGPSRPSGGRNYCPMLGPENAPYVLLTSPGPASREGSVPGRLWAFWTGT